MNNLNDFATNIYNIQLAFLGISTTVFTVLFAFILSKRDEIKLLNFEIEKGNKSPSIQQRRNFAISNVRKLKKINQKALFFIIITSFVFIISFFVSNFKFCSEANHIIYYSLLLIVILEILLLLVVIVSMIKYYKKSTRI